MNVYIWDIDGNKVQTLTMPDTKMRAIAFHPREQILATGTADQRVRLWNLDGSQIKESQRLGGAPYVLAWSPDGQQLITDTDLGRRFQMWDLKNDKIETLPEPGKTPLCGADWNPDGLQYVTISENVVNVWSSEDQKVLWSAALLPEGQTVVFSADGKILHGDAETIKQELVYLVETPQGRLTVLSHSQFADLSKKAPF